MCERCPESGTGFGWAEAEREVTSSRRWPPEQNYDKGKPHGKKKQTWMRKIAKDHADTAGKFYLSQQENLQTRFLSYSVLESTVKNRRGG